MAEFENHIDTSDIVGLTHRSVHGAAATAGGQVVKFALQFLSQVWLARLISPAEYGLIAMVAPIMSFIAIIGDMGIGMALVQQKSVSQSQISALFWLNTALSVAVSSVLIVISPAVGWLYHEPKTITITIALALLFFVGTLGIHPAALLNREMRLSRRAAIECIQSAIGLVVGVLTARAGCGYWSLVYMQTANIVSGVLMAWWSVGWLPSRPHWDPSASQILRFGASLTVSNIAVYFNMSADNMIVGAANGKVALGLYDKAYRLVAMPLLQFSAPIGRVAIPLLSSLNGEPERYASAFRRMIQLPSLICVPGLICGMFLSPQLVHVLLGPSWSGVTKVFSWICFGGIASSLYGSAFWLFTSQGRGREQMKWTVITSAISIVSFLIGIRWGVVGVASVSALTFVVVQTPILIWSATRVGPVTARFVIDAIRPIAISFFITAPVLYLYSGLLHINAVAEILGGVALTGAVYLLAISTMRSGREMLSGASVLTISYLTRLRANLQRVPL